MSRCVLFLSCQYPPRPGRRQRGGGRYWRWRCLRVVTSRDQRDGLRRVLQHQRLPHLHAAEGPHRAHSPRPHRRDEVSISSCLHVQRPRRRRPARRLLRPPPAPLAHRRRASLLAPAGDGDLRLAAPPAHQSLGLSLRLPARRRSGRGEGSPAGGRDRRELAPVRGGWCCDA